MDYSVGSLSDLITGANTPNKLKVVRKQITPKKKKSNDDNLEIETTEIDQNAVALKKKKVKKNKNDSFVESPFEKTTKKRKFPAEENIEDPNVPLKKKKIKKNKNDASVESSLEEQPAKMENSDEPNPKKSKNSKNAERRVNLKEKIPKQEEDPELVARTIFVGNLPISSDTKKLKKFFKKYGQIEAVRIRGAPVADPKTPKKVAIIKKEFHPERKSFYGFIRYEQREDAVKATEANGVIYQDHHLRIHLCDAEDKPDETKAIFVGNLSFYAEEDDLWKIFESCGPISSVRIVRDGKTGIGKGFGYVNFQNSDSVPLALEMENVKVKDRELRISICNIGTAKKNKKNNKIKKINKPGQQRRFKKVPKTDKNVENKEPDQGTNNENKSFQGIKFAEKKKKNKLGQGLRQKKRMIKKVAPK